MNLPVALRLKRDAAYFKPRLDELSSLKATLGWKTCNDTLILPHPWTKASWALVCSNHVGMTCNVQSPFSTACQLPIWSGMRTLTCQT